MSEWKKVKLGDICERVTSGGTPKANLSSYYFPPIIPWLKTKEVNYCRITETENFISEEGLNNSSAKLIAPNSVIIAMYGQGDTAGRVAINKIPLTTNQACCNLTIDESKADYEFIYYQLCTLYNKMVSLKAGAAQPNLNAQIIKNLEVLLPSLPTQHRIATILSRYDSLIENYQKQIKLLEEAAQRLYKEWFVDLHFPGHENTKIVDGVPEGWEKKKVGDITPIKTGKKDANFGTSDGAYPFFTCSQEPIKAPSYSFDTSAVILAGNGDFNVKLYRGKFEAYQRTYVLEPINEKMLYLLYFCISENMNRLATGASGSTIKFLTKGMIESLVINKPSTIVLDSFNQIIEPIRTQKENLQTQIRLLTEARDRLLPKMMSGEVKIDS
jgi:type I restriction enzyme S subunit